MQDELKISDDEIKSRSMVSKEEWREYTKSVWHIANVTHGSHPAVFPEEIPHRLTKLFSFWGETVLDPFAGVGTTALAALKIGRRAILVDQNREYIDVALRSIEDLGVEPSRVTADVADNRNMPWIADDSIGLIVTSPPYWNKADYGSSPANLGNADGYRVFIESMRPTFLECMRVLKPGRKIAIVTANVSQHTEHGLLSFPLATDIAVLLRELGFVMINEVIWSKDGTGGRWGSWGAQRPIFGSYPYPPNFLFKTVHEYILIFAKPPSKKTRGPKVRWLDEIMRDPDVTSSRDEPDATAE